MAPLLLLLLLLLLLCGLGCTTTGIAIKICVVGIIKHMVDVHLLVKGVLHVVGHACTERNFIFAGIINGLLNIIHFIVGVVVKTVIHRVSRVGEFGCTGLLVCDLNPAVRLIGRVLYGYAQCTERNFIFVGGALQPKKYQRNHHAKKANSADSNAND